jgi:gas vesicle protein
MSAARDWTIFLAGATLGAAVALAYAPQSGEKTRKQVRRNLEDASDYVKEATEDFGKHAKRVYKSAKGTASDVAARLSSTASDLADSAKDLV